MQVFRTDNGAYALITAILIASPDVQAETVELSAGFVKVLTLDRPYKSAAVGNPAVADIRPAGTERTVFISARAMGETNVIFLDESDRTILDVNVAVTADGREFGRVVVIRGTLPPNDPNRITVSRCTPHCVEVDDRANKVKRMAPWPGIPQEQETEEKSARGPD